MAHLSWVGPLFRVVSVEVSIFSYATEDERKVERALFNLVPEEVIRQSLRVERLSGHYRDPLLLIRGRIKDGEAAGEILRRLVMALPPVERERLVLEVEDRVDEANNLYLRLDKQKAYLGRVLMGEADAIRFKFKFSSSRDPLSAIRSHLTNIIEGAEN
jgi:RNA binding exosome subunit